MGEGSETKRTKLTNESNEKVAQMNIDYQKEYNAQVFQREDTANQRAVADMRAAGLNPLANYSPSGSGGVAAAPQSNMHYESGNSKLMENLQALQAGTSIAESLQNQALGLQQMQQNSAALQGQKLLNQSQSMANQYDRMTLIDRANQQKFSSASMQQSVARAQYDYEYRKYYGIHEGDDIDTIRAKIIATNLLKTNPDTLNYSSGYRSGYGDTEINESFSPYRDSDDKHLHNLQNMLSASYGEVSDKVTSLVDSLIKQRLKISNSKSDSKR